MQRKSGLSVIQWAQLFQLQAQPGLPLHARLRLAVVQAILEERLTPGTALPSSRDLAHMLGLSRNTVTAAYQQLMDDGYLASRQRLGVLSQPMRALCRLVKQPRWTTRFRALRRPPGRRLTGRVACCAP